MELAQAFQRLGSQVTILAPRLLPHDDPEAAEVLRRVFEREGVQWIRGRAVCREARVPRVSSSRRMQEARRAARQLLVAAGRRPNIEGLGLDRAASPTRSAGIPVDDRLRRTSRTSTRRATFWEASNSRTWLGGRPSRRLGTRCFRAVPPAVLIRWRG